MGTHGGPSRDTFGFSIDITLTMTVCLSCDVIDAQLRKEIFRIYLFVNVFLVIEDMYKYANANAASEFQRQDRKGHNRIG
ncbi:hypothetical protein V1478_000524 [Vespula squamosa]|uniref:Uncharacterized protein n=1 Tax=Vespula squamosa TaxID=30214 RepID=A0ABD2C5Q6_VESSQ